VWPQSITRPIFEVAFTFALIIFALWIPRPMQDWVSLVAFLWIFGSTMMVRENRARVELGLDGFGRSLWVIGSALALGAIEIVIARHEQTLHEPFSTGALSLRIWGYVIWSFLQQFILQNYFLVRLLRVFRPGWAIVISASLFALAHVPNPLLTFATLIWGLLACALFLRYRDIYSLGFAHALFGLTLTICIPASIHHNMRVGLGYLRYHPKEHNQRSQIPHRVSTEAWVMAEAATRRSALQARP
jgi:membrane protease YdiL (CAAX protease family)